MVDVIILIGVIALVGICVKRFFISGKKWNYRYGDNVILVKFRLTGCELFVNDELQDKIIGSITNASALQGKLKGGEEVRATFGGAAFVKCVMRIDNKVQNPV